MKNKVIGNLALSVFACLFTTSPTMSAEVEKVHADYREIGRSEDWRSIYRPGDNGKTGFCAIYSRPKKAQIFRVGEAIEAMRGEMAAFVNWENKEPTKDTGVVSFMVGVPVAEGLYNNHMAVIDGKHEFELIAEKDQLFAKPQDDEKFVKAMRQGYEVVLTAVLKDGTRARDVYSLKGLMSASNISISDCK